MRGVARPEAIGFTVLLLYMIFLSFLSVHLLEENRRLREELKNWETLKLLPAPKKPRFYPGR